MNTNEKNNSNIPEMEFNNQYKNENPILNGNSNKINEEINSKKKELDKFKNFALKKYPFIQSIGLLPSVSIKEFIEEEINDEIPKKGFDKLKNKSHLYIIFPEDKLKEFSKIKEEIIKYIEKEKMNFWIYIKTPLDIWEICFDSKFEMIDAIAMSYPLYDKGLLSGLKIATIHKSLVLQKFDKYVVSYVIGGSLVRGDLVQNSDVDSFVIINDTDVKRMPRLELKERLRGMIYQYISEASLIAGLKENVLNVQVYLLTEFWESVKDAHPVMFTFIRDGVPLYDKGTFMPWKVLLKMGKLKPSPEAIDVFMSMGDNTVKRAKKALLDILINEIYWSVVTPSQALLMLNGSSPPVPKHLVSEMKNVFVNKEKMLEKKYINTLSEILKAYKDYEHEKIKEVKGSKIDRLIIDSENYLKRLRELRKQIEKKYQKRTIEEINKELFDLLRIITGKKSRIEIIKSFNKLIKKGKFTYQHLKILNEVIDIYEDFKKGKTNLKNIDFARRNARILINDLIDFSQRCDLVNIERSKINLKYGKNKEKIAEIFITKEAIFLFYDNLIKKIKDKKIIDSDSKEVSKAIKEQKSNSFVGLNSEIFEILNKELGEFEITL
jgi:predicted nucleotidyltransferase